MIFSSFHRPFWHYRFGMWGGRRGPETKEEKEEERDREKNEQKKGGEGGGGSGEGRGRCSIIAAERMKRRRRVGR